MPSRWASCAQHPRNEAICFPETVKNRPIDLQNTSHLADDQDPTLILYSIYDCTAVGESQKQAIIIDRFYSTTRGEISECSRSDLYIKEYLRCYLKLVFLNKMMESV